MALERNIEIKPGEEYIKLGALLKFAGVVDRGSDEKSFLATNDILLNGKPENRRGAKIRPGDKVTVNGNLILNLCVSKS